MEGEEEQRAQVERAQSPPAAAATNNAGHEDAELVSSAASSAREPAQQQGEVQSSEWRGLGSFSRALVGVGDTADLLLPLLPDADMEYLHVAANVKVHAITSCNKQKGNK